jgi:hypothetical protein
MELTRISSETRVILPPTHLDLLAAPALAHVATIGPDGAPQSTPVWFDWDGARLRIGLAPDRQKLRNLEIRGRASFESDPDQAALARIIRKYTGSDDLSWVDGERIIVAIEPTHATYQG